MTDETKDEVSLRSLSPDEHEELVRAVLKPLVSFSVRTQVVTLLSIARELCRDAGISFAQNVGMALLVMPDPPPSARTIGTMSDVYGVNEKAKKQ